MGFFDAIKTGLGAAVNFVSQNSGTILGVAGAVAKVAGLVALAEDDENEFLTGDPVLDLQANYNKATEALESIANQTTATSLRSKLPQKLTASATGVKFQNSTLTGIWKSPSSLDDDGQPPVGQYQDIAKFLHQSNLPLLLTGKTGTRDVARDISLSIFSNANHDGTPMVTDDNGVNTLTFEVIDKDTNCSVFGTHAYYELPMGQVLDENSWHSAVNVQCVTTPQARAEHAALKQSLVFHAAAPQGIKDVWLVTLKVAWTAVPIAVAAWPLISDYFKKTLGSYVITYHALEGTIDVIKIQAPEGVTPAQVKSALTQGIADALAKLNTRQVFKSVSLENNVTYQLPSITVTGTSITTGGSDQSKQRVPQKQALNGVHQTSTSAIQAESQDDFPTHLSKAPQMATINRRISSRA